MGKFIFRRFPTEIGGYILHEAVRSGSLKMVALCVQYGANIHAKDSLNETPLHESSSDDNWLEITKYLIEHGADINAIGAFNVTPLHSALFSESKKTAKLLVKSGASLTIKDANERTPIQVAQEKNNSDLVTWFEEYIHKNKEP